MSVEQYIDDSPSDNTMRIVIDNDVVWDNFISLLGDVDIDEYSPPPRKTREFTIEMLQLLRRELKDREQGVY